MNDRIDLSLSPTGGNAAGTVRVTAEVIEFHVARARKLRAQSIRETVVQALRTVAGRRATQESTDCADAAWLARG